MQCPKCQRKNFEIDKSCPQCGFQLDATRLAELAHMQWLLDEMGRWESFDHDTASLSNLRETYTSRLKDTQVALGLRPPSFTAEEAEKGWIELAHLELFFEKVEEWRVAGYFKPEMESQDPVRAQRAYADELRQRLEEYQRTESPQTGQDKLKTVSFLLDQIDLLASRGWFKKKELENIIAPLMAMMADAFSGNEPE